MLTKTAAELGFKETQEVIIKKQRDVSLDIAKGIGIILVVFGHTFQVYSVTSYVYAFHMPLFFLLSGCTFNTQKYLKNPRGFLRRNFLKLIVPYFGAAIISYILYTFLAPTLSLPEVTVSAAIFGILNGNGQNLPFNDVLWFLPAFFFAGLIFLALGLIFKGAKLFVSVMLVSFLGILIGLTYPLPFGLDIAMTTQFFIYCGHLLREHDLLKKIKISKTRAILIYLPLAAILLLVLLIFSSLNGRIDLMTRVYGQPVIFFIGGLCGSASVLMIALVFSIEGKQYSYVGKILQTTGRASMYVFISHIAIFYCLAAVCSLLWGFWIYYTFETFWYLLFIIGVFVPTSVYVLSAFIRKRNSKEKSLQPSITIRPSFLVQDLLPVNLYDLQLTVFKRFARTIFLLNNERIREKLYGRKDSSNVNIKWKTK